MDTFNLQTNQIDIQQETVKHIGLALMQAEDIIQFNSLTSGLNQINASQGGNQDFPTNFSFNDALTITGYLTLNDTPYIYEPISGSDKFGTTPGRPAYGGLTPAALRPSFQADTSFVETPYYGESIYSGQEIGRLGNIVLNTSKNIPIFQDASVNGNPIYQTIVTGANAYMELHLDGVDKVLMQNGAAFTGPNALQMVANGRNIYGTGIVQPTWCVNVLSTAGINPAI
jgi:N4-gp56 family major capsid protein